SRWALRPPNGWSGVSAGPAMNPSRGSDKSIMTLALALPPPTYVTFCGSVLSCLFDPPQRETTTRRQTKMGAIQPATSPAPYFAPFTAARSLGIDRGNYIAIQSDNPTAAAQYAVKHMGFYLVHRDGEGRHYLAAHGLDPYSLVYTPGEQGKLD